MGQVKRKHIKGCWTAKSSRINWWWGSEVPLLYPCYMDVCLRASVEQHGTSSVLSPWASGEQNKPPITQEEAVNNLLCHLEELAGQATLHHLSAVLAHRGGLRWLEDHQCNTHLQEGAEGGSWELRACQPDLGARQDYAAIHPKCAH